MRLAKDEMFLQKYDPIFQDQINAGMIEEVNTEGLVGNVTYLPHKEVIKNESITIKVRIVFDASAKLKHEVSLNDILCVCVCVCVLVFFHREGFLSLQNVQDILEGTDQRSCVVNISSVPYAKFHHLCI